MSAHGTCRRRPSCCWSLRNWQVLSLGRSDRKRSLSRRFLMCGHFVPQVVGGKGRNEHATRDNSCCVDAGRCESKKQTFINSAYEILHKQRYHTTTIIDATIASRSQRETMPPTPLSTTSVEILRFGKPLVGHRSPALGRIRPIAVGARGLKRILLARHRE